MKYFLHSTDSFHDEKIAELFLHFGYEGLGLFYTILEKIAFSESPIKTNVLKHQLKVGKKLEKCWKFMESLGLISSNNDKENILNMSSVESEKIFHSFIDEKILNGKIFELKNILTFLNESKISNLVFKNEQEFSNEQINVCKLLYNNLEDELLDHFLKNENNRKMLNLPI